MPGQRLPMRKIRDVLRLTAAGMSSRKIAASLVVGATTVVDCLQRARAAGVSWPLLDDLSDEALEARLFPASTALAEIRARRPQPHWPTIHRELRRPGVTLQLVWEEHRAAHPEGYGYSRFCELYRAWEGRLSPTMRQTHVAGERLFVDYAGTTLDVIDASTGEAMPAQLFVAALGASNYTYAEATWTQGLADWIGSHTRTFAFFDGVSAMVVSDNLKSGITKACFYEPAVNRTYAEMAAHYDTAVVPARPNKPRDKAKVEVAVQVATRWIIAKLRNRRFFSLGELNAAIAELVTALNNRVTRHLGASRRALFDDLERSALKKLPAEPYAYAECANRAREQGVPLKPQLIECCERRYDAIVAEGLAFHEAQVPLARAAMNGGGKGRGRAPRRTGHNLLLRLATRKQDTLRFLHDPTVPFTNNQAERDGRMMKLRQKISGGFRSPQGAMDFALIRSFFSTARKQGWNIIDALTRDPSNLAISLRLC